MIMCLYSTDTLHFIIPPYLSPLVQTTTESLLAPAAMPPTQTTPSPVKWASAPSFVSEDAPILSISLPQSSGLVKQIAWHRRGDYLASVSSSESQGGVWIHQTTRRHSQAPFKKIRGVVQMVQFHPTKPHFVVAVRLRPKQPCFVC